MNNQPPITPELIGELLRGITPGEWRNEGQVITSDYCVVIGDETYKWRFVGCFPIDNEEGTNPDPITHEQAIANANFFVAAPSIARYALELSEKLKLIEANYEVVESLSEDHPEIKFKSHECPFTVTKDGYVLIHRAAYPHFKANGMSDGDIVAAIHPNAYKDIADAIEIVNWHNQRADLAPTGDAGCVWEVDMDGCWDTACGQAFYFDDRGAPREHGFKFCPFCKEVIALTPPEGKESK